MFAISKWINKKETFEVFVKRKILTSGYENLNELPIENNLSENVVPSGDNREVHQVCLAGSEVGSQDLNFWIS